MLQDLGNFRNGTGIAKGSAVVDREHESLSGKSDP